VAQNLIDGLMTRLRPTGLANMHAAPITACERDSHPALYRQGLAQGGPIVINALVLELRAQHMHYDLRIDASQEM
jgi:hypothetical protein